MIPETSAAKRVELYRADPFPSRWRFERVLLTGVVADDATLLQHDGRLWLFVNIAPDGTGPMNGELFLYFADSIAGEWLPHPWNPIVADVRSARPAGRVFRRDGRLIRPSQDCARRYGHATVFNQIETLTTTEYRERPVARLDPDWIPGNLGTHSYGSDAAFEVVDGYCERWRFPFGRAQT